MRFGAYTGLRAGEIVALRVNDLNFLRRTIHVRRSAARLDGEIVETEPKTKSGRRIVSVPRALWQELVDHLGNRATVPDALVFGYGRRHFTYGVFKDAARASLPEQLHRLRFHDLRHTSASFLVEQSAHPKEMAELLGHSSVQITLDRYSHVMPHMQEALADRLDVAYRETHVAPVTSLDHLGTQG